ncbi:MAG: hypothetical protein FWC57_01755 [Endomicrobia bacterium]|nr:hypothetical protein [Endomicrobiia bacterium]
MKKSASKFIAAVLFAVFFAAQTAFAHPPSKIEITPKGETLAVTVTHNVKDPTKHYIKEVVVTVNGKEAADKKETRQTHTKTQTASFDIPGLKSGDKVSVKATCNLYGSKTVEITVQ